MTWLLRQVFLGGSSGHFCSYKWVVDIGWNWVSLQEGCWGFASLGSRCEAQCEYISLCPSFLCERSQLGTAATPESPHRLSKPLPPSLPPPEVLLASCLNAVVRVAICFLNFSIIVNKSIPQPLVIGIFLSRNGWFYSFSHSSLCSAVIICCCPSVCTTIHSELSLESDSWRVWAPTRHMQIWQVPRIVTYWGD